MVDSSNSELIVRKATVRDLPDIHALVRELAVFEQSPEAVKTTVEVYDRDFKNGCFDAFILEQSSTIIGMALFYWGYSTWKGRMLYLDDLVITEAHRRQGLGSLLFEAIVKEGRQQGASLIKWQVLDWNEPALQFYKKHGATIETDWYNAKLMLIEDPR